MNTQRGRDVSKEQAMSKSGVRYTRRGAVCGRCIARNVSRSDLIAVSTSTLKVHIFNASCTRKCTY